MWKAFGAFEVEYLGIPGEAMPLYSDGFRVRKKAAKFAFFVMEVGNMGHTRDTSYYTRYPKLICKMFSMWRMVGDTIRHTRIFPMDSLRFLPWELYYGIRAAMKGE